MKRSLVLGCNGQTGSYLCEHLLAQGRQVHGMVRHSSAPLQLWRLEGIRNRLTLHEGDLTDYSSLDRIVRDVAPDEVYNLADQDSVGYSMLAPLYSVQVTYGGVANLLEVCRRFKGLLRVFQPISSTVFKGRTPHYADTPAKGCNEETELDPQSPYAVAKAAAWHLCRHYRQRHGLHVSCAVPFGHDSPRRNAGYLLGKLAREARLVAEGKLSAITVGSLDLRVDIGYAKEFAAGYVKLLELPEPDDLVLGTGSGIRIVDLADFALTLADPGPLPGLKEWVQDSALGGNMPKPVCRGLVDKVKVDPKFAAGRLVELVADCSKAKAAIGWEPRFDALRTLRLLMGKEEG